MSRAPLVDVDVDLRDFPFMPIDITRLFGSEFNAVSDDATWCAGMKLWLKSYHQVPAASVSGNDLALARLCEVTSEKWAKIKKGALRGWVKCSDGRWYHPVVAEKALEGWIEKLAQRKASAAGNAKRYGHQFDASPFDVSIDRAKGQLEKLNPRSRTLSKRHAKYQTLPSGSQPAPAGSEAGVPSGSQETETGKGREEITEKDISLSGDRAQDDTPSERERDFSRFSNEYPPDGLGLPDEARRALDAKLDEGVPIDDIVDGARRYAATCREQGRKGRYVTAAQSWLAGGGWKGAKPAAFKQPIDQTYVLRADPSWPALERLYIERDPQRRGQGPPKYAKGWYFANQWIQEIRECVP